MTDSFDSRLSPNEVDEIQRTWNLDHSGMYEDCPTACELQSFVLNLLEYK